jgi:hypothetical protein
LNQALHNRKASHQPWLSKLKSPGKGFGSLEILDCEETKLLAKAIQHAA